MVRPIKNENIMDNSYEKNFENIIRLRILADAANPPNSINLKTCLKFIL